PYRVVLSSCSSAIGAAVGSDELLGLVSALISLGSAGGGARVVTVNDPAPLPPLLALPGPPRGGSRPPPTPPPPPPPPPPPAPPPRRRPRPRPSPGPRRAGGRPRPGGPVDGGLLHRARGVRPPPDNRRRPCPLLPPMPAPPGR